MDPVNYTAVLDFWFANRERDALTLDSRMNGWFGSAPAFDAQLTEQFSDLVNKALTNELDVWAAEPRGQLALILLLGQFPRHIYKNSEQAFLGDQKALLICERGVSGEDYRKLNALEQLFFFMPLQRAESLKIQQTSVTVFSALARRVSETMRDTFDTVAQFAELRHDIIEKFGRFPHRNGLLGRASTGEEETYLSV